MRRRREWAAAVVDGGGGDDGDAMKSFVPRALVPILHGRRQLIAAAVAAAALPNRSCNRRNG